eukprot:TRINITY_DN12622_c0_g1_i9.p1 TRINITY_DN12622_c0_g1~~TRINITY_DN12622_c0_g1_i9.p1  ORF type:complete len:322 (-),score=79.63 TRINITY_DN12622_c0_g1_i9:109-1074(-)
MIRRPPRSTLSSSSAASDVYKRQVSTQSTGDLIQRCMATSSIPMAMDTNTNASLSASLSSTSSAVKRFDDTSVVEFFSKTRVYDVMPENFKLPVLHHSLSLMDSFSIMAQHQCQAAAVWKEDSCAGVLTAAELAALVMETARDGTLDSSMELGLDQVNLELRTESAGPDTTVLEALGMMMNKHALLQIAEAGMDCPVFIFTYPRILRYVMSHFQDAEGDAMLEQSIGSLPCCQQGQVQPIESTSTVLDAIEKLVKHKLGYLPVLDSQGVVLALFTSDDVLTIAGSTEGWKWLDRPLCELMDSCEWIDTLQTCLRSENLVEV